MVDSALSIDAEELSVETVDITDHFRHTSSPSLVSILTSIRALTKNPTKQQIDLRHLYFSVYCGNEFHSGELL